MYICITITFNNPIKAYFLIKKYATLQPRPTQILNSIFPIENPVLTGLLKIIFIQNYF